MKRLLETIHEPPDIRNFSTKQLEQFAQEMRDEVLASVSEAGGHLASTLGAVELTLALHYVFDTPKDRLVWDTGHQTYAHKLLCGRRNQLSKIRQLGGISGFLCRSESEYDTFGAGHAGTSVSAALGMATAKSLDDATGKVIAVISDGGMTAGLNFEGLNQAGHLKRDLIVVLNDNGIFIDPKVGALSSGELCPFFKSLGFDYTGPVNGHNLKELIRALKTARQNQKAMLVHVKTQKGKGYEPAERDPIRYHSVTPFHVPTGKPKKEKSPVATYTGVFASSLVRIAQENPKVIGITAAMGSGTGIDKLSAAIPERAFDVGLAEQHAVTFAAGMATEGWIPIVAIYSTFLQRGYDQILHDVCLQNLHVIFALDRAGLVGADGPTHHGVFDLAYLRSIPNMVVMAPKDENELQHMLQTAILHTGPVAIRYPRGEGWGVETDENLATMDIGKAEILREGKDLAILGLGNTVMPAVRAAEALEHLGIDATVVNARFAKPLDGDLLRGLVRKVPCVVTVEDHALQGGFGSAVLEFLAEERLGDLCIRRLGIPDRFVPHGTQAELQRICGIDTEGIFQAAIQLLRARKKNLRQPRFQPEVYGQEARIANQ